MDSFILQPGIDIINIGTLWITFNPNGIVALDELVDEVGMLLQLYLTISGSLKVKVGVVHAEEIVVFVLFVKFLVVLGFEGSLWAETHWNFFYIDMFLAARVVCFCDLFQVYVHIFFGFVGQQKRLFRIIIPTLPNFNKC